MDQTLIAKGAQMTRRVGFAFLKNLAWRKDTLQRFRLSLHRFFLFRTEASLFDVRQREERAHGTGTSPQQNGSLIALFRVADDAVSHFSTF